MDPDAIAKAVDRARAEWTREMRRMIEQDLDRVSKAADDLKESAHRGFVASTELVTALLALDGTLSPKGELAVQVPVRYTPQPERLLTRAPAAKPIVAADGVSPSQQKVLNALAAFEQLGFQQVKRVNVAFFAGYTENGHFNNMLGALRTAGLIDYPAGGMLSLTSAGRAVADGGATIRSLQELHATWLSKVSPSEAKLLKVLIDVYPDSIGRAALAAHTGYTENGHFNNMLGHLRTLGAADYPAGGEVAATEALFPKGLR